MHISAARLMGILGISVLGLILCGCSTAPESDTDRAVLHNDSTAAIVDFQQRDEGIRDFLQGAYGYVVFPEIGRGGILAGGAYGRGEVYARGRLVGYATITEATVGAQLGGQEYSELIVFGSKQALDDFEAGDFSLSAQVSAVVIETGVAEKTKYIDGVAVFVDLKGGFMGEASVGGQKFLFEPI
jgi:lipid-binding SYLF domain-containing protein